MNSPAVAQPVVLLEREHELERVRAALRAAGQRSGGVLVIEGPAGIGKSRLLEQAQLRGVEVGLNVLEARGTELEQGFPYGVVRQLFERPLAEAGPDERERWLAGAAALAVELLTGAPVPVAGASASGDPGYAWQHGLYWLASNLSVDAPLVLLVDDLQWCDGPSIRALAFIARRLSGQPLALIIATRPLDPGVTPDAASLVSDPAAELMRPSPLTSAAVGGVIASRLGSEPAPRFVRACLDVAGGNPFLLGELLDEAAARGLEPTAAAAGDIAAIVPRGVANAVLLRLARLAPSAATLARSLSVLGDGALVGDAARLAGVAGPELETAMGTLVSAGVMESGGTVRFTHPILRTAIYGDLSAAERERLHGEASRILSERGAAASQVAAHVMYTEPAANPTAVQLLRDAAAGALSLGDASGASALLARALDEPPDRAARTAVVLELGLARARAGAPDAVGPLSEIAIHGEDDAAIAAAAIELSGMLFFADRAVEAAAILQPGEAATRAGQCGPRAARGRAAGSELYVSVGAARGRRDDRGAARPWRAGDRGHAGHHAGHARDGRAHVRGHGGEGGRLRLPRDRRRVAARAPSRRGVGARRAGRADGYGRARRGAARDR